jgi:hypothetical protein
LADLDEETHEGRGDSVDAEFQRPPSVRPLSRASAIFERLPAGLAASAATAAAAASTASAPATTAVAESSATKPAPTRRLGTRLVHGKRATPELRLVQLINGLLRIVIVRHFNEREATRAPGSHVTHDTDRVDGSNSTEQLFQLSFSGLVRKITHKQPATHD